MNMKKIIALLLTLVLAVSLVACGSSTPAATEAPAADAPAAETSAAPAASGSKTLKLILSTTDGSSTDDKVPTPWLNHTMATNLMWRGLLIADSSLTKTSPDLAESVVISEDGMTYTITLKEGLKWSDGEDLTAEDVIWSIEAVQKATNINSIYTAAFNHITSLTADGNVITMVLDSTYASMNDVLAQFYILPEHALADADPAAIDADDFWKNPVTSSYFKMGELNTGNYFTLVPNEYYEGTAPKIESVTVSYVNDYLTAAQSGAAHYLHGNSSDLYNAISAMDNFTTIDIDVLFYKYFIFNMKGVDGVENEAMQDVNVRRAIMHAVDRATLATLYPSAAVLNSGVPNSHDAYNGYEYTYDVEEAKALLAASSYDLSRPLRICYYNNDQTSIDLINTVVYYLQEVGFTVEATLSNDGTTDLFTTRAYDVGFKGKSSFSMEEWYSEYKSNDALFGNIFAGDTAFDEAINALSAATTDAEKNAALTALQALEQELVYKVPVFTVGNAVYLSNELILPEGAGFCNPLYACDMDFANWDIA